jgi:Fanconi-associated nuclease 1
LKEYEYELEVLDALLSQNRWRRGRRGKWYDRRALILTTHFPKDDIEIATRAMAGVVDALLDDDTHISEPSHDISKAEADL